MWRAVDGSISLGQSIHAGGPRVRADKLLKDSRCPVNARYVQAGRVVLRATVTGEAWFSTLDLTLGQSVPIADGLLALVRITPKRKAGRAVKAASYRSAFEFQGSL